MGPNRSSSAMFRAIAFPFEKTPIICFLCQSFKKFDQDWFGSKRESYGSKAMTTEE
jgi:hypothetical protein